MFDDATAMSASPSNATRNRSDSREVAWDRFWGEVHKPGNVHPSEFTRWAVPFLKRAKTHTVIDLGCGPGRDMTFLLENGFGVTGVDCSPVAVGLAQELVGTLPKSVAGHAALVHSGVLGFLAGLPAESVDAVHASATYQGLSDPELSRLFDEIHRVMTSHGVHVWSVRSARHTGRTKSETVPPNFPALGFTVPLRFLTREDTERLASEGFDRVALEGVEAAPGMFSFRIADRKR
jgi:SAM-dependent methyltransferase